MDTDYLFHVRQEWGSIFMGNVDSHTLQVQLITYLHRKREGCLDHQ